MKESALLTELGASFREAGGWWYKLPDPSAHEEVDEKTGKKRRWMGASKRPFDAIAHLWRSGVVHGDVGTWYAIETKVARSGNPQAGITRVAQHQWEALQDVAARGWQARVLVLVENRQVDGITHEFAELAVYKVQPGYRREDGLRELGDPEFLQREGGRWPVERL